MLATSPKLRPLLQPSCNREGFSDPDPAEPSRTTIGGSEPPARPGRKKGEQLNSRQAFPIRRSQPKDQAVARWRPWQSPVWSTGRPVLHSAVIFST